MRKPEQKVSEDAGKEWVTQTLYADARIAELRIHSCTWELQPGPGGENLYSLSVESGKKKAGRIFSAEELRQCCSNSSTQTELQVRLIKLLAFLSRK